MVGGVFFIDYPKASLEKKEYLTERMHFWKNQITFLTSIL